MEPQDIEKLKNALLPELKKTLKEEVEAGHKGLSDQITSLQTQLTATDTKLKPISEVYNSVSVFGTVLNWIVKKILIPVSIVLGILLTYNSLKK